MPRHILTGNLTGILYAAAAKRLIIRVEHFHIVPLGWHTNPIIMMNLRRKVAKCNNKVIAVFCLADKRHNAIVAVIRIDPLETIPIEIHLPERFMLQIELVERFGISQHLRMHIILLHQMPIQTILIIPLNKLTKLTAHKEQFLAWMSHPVTKEVSEPSKLLPVIARHLADQRALAMDYFVMRQRQDKILGKSIHE